MSDSFRALGANDRLALAGIGIVAVSLLLPWHGVMTGDYVKTPASSLGFIEVAIVLTLAAGAYLLARAARDQPLPAPLHIGTMLAVTGVWTAVLIAYRIFDRPDFTEFPGERVALRYGIFIAFAGAALIVVGGLRRRRDELAAEDAARARSDDKPRGEPLNKAGE